MKKTNLIQGAGGGGGKGKGGSARVAVEAPDSLRSRQYANVLDLVSEGEIEGLVNGLKSVYLDDTPLQNEDNTYNFTGIAVEGRNGTQSQTYINGFAGAESEFPVSVEITQPTPVVRTITNANATGLRITVSTPQLTSQNTKNGDISGTSVSLNIEIQTDGGGYQPAEIRRQYLTSFFALGNPSFTTADATKFNIVVTWTPLPQIRPQTIYYKLQYRVRGDVTWLDYESTNFSGNPYKVNQRYQYYGGWYNNIVTLAPSTQTKTFAVTLPSDQYEFQVVKLSGDGSIAITYGEGYFPLSTDTISGKTTSKYQRAYYIQLPTGSQWDIRITRLTPDSTTASLQNKTFWDSYTEIIDAKLSYPNSAIIGVQIDAEQFSRIPVRGYEIRGIKVKIPSNYNPLTREYTGTWDGTFTVAWSDNPAWVFYDIVTNERYGLGEYIDEAMIDKWALYNIAQYCDVLVDDGFGGVEPRFTCNLYLQSREQAYQVISNIASIFRAMVFWASGSITLAQDSPKDVTQFFSPANVIDGAFNYSGSSGRVRHTVALVSWNDQSDGYRPKIEYVADNEAIERYGIVQTELVAIGCTSRGQAARMGRWLIYSEQNETETISFKAGMDSVFLQAGDIVEINDPNRSGKRLGGRVVSATTTAITLDAPITIESGKTYEISCKLSDGTIESKNVTNAVGSTSIITVGSAFTSAPLRNAMWIIAVSDLLPEQWRVVSISEVEKSTLEITALSYRPDKYDAVEQDLILQPLPTSIYNANRPNSPANVTILESLYLAGIAVVGVKAVISWDYVPQATNYIVSYQVEDETEVVLNSDKNSIEALNLIEGRYTFKVIAVDSLGRRSSPAEVIQDILGKTVAPDDVVNLQVAPLGSIGLFTWNEATDLDVLVGGSVRFRYSPNLLATWESANDLVTSVGGNSTSTTLPLQTGIYFAKYQDSSGNISTNATSVFTNAASIISLNFIETLLGQPNWLGTKINTQIDDDIDLTALKLSSFDLWDSDELIDGNDLVDYGGGVASNGSYALGQIDLGSVQTSRISNLVEAVGFDLQDKWDADELIDSVDLVDGDTINASAKIYYRVTDDDPLSIPTWSDWNASAIADVTARAYEFELRLTTDSLYHNILVTRAEAEIDMPDRIESGDNISSGTMGYTVTYSKPFIVSPALGLSAENMATGDYYVLSSKTNTGFTITFYNSSNVAINRTFDYIAKAY